MVSNKSICAISFLTFSNYWSLLLAYIVFLPSHLDSWSWIYFAENHRRRDDHFYTSAYYHIQYPLNMHILKRNHFILNPFFRYLPSQLRQEKNGVMVPRLSRIIYNYRQKRREQIILSYQNNSLTWLWDSSS